MSLVVQDESNKSDELRQSKSLFWLGCVLADFLSFLGIVLASNPSHGLAISYSVALFWASIFATISLIRTTDRTLSWSRIKSFEPPETMTPIANNLWYYGCTWLFIGSFGFIIRTWLFIHFWHFLLYRDKSLEGALAQFWDTRTLIVGSSAAFILGFLKPKYRIDVFDGLGARVWGRIKRLLRRKEDS
jgi:hypothetical protein